MPTRYNRSFSGSLKQDWDKNAWAASAHPTENGVARINGHARMFSGCLNLRRVGIYAHAVQPADFRQPETGLADKNAWTTRVPPAKYPLPACLTAVCKPKGSLKACSKPFQAASIPSELMPCRLCEIFII